MFVTFMAYINQQLTSVLGYNFIVGVQVLVLWPESAVSDNLPLNNGVAHEGRIFSNTLASLGGCLAGAVSGAGARWLWRGWR